MQIFIEDIGCVDVDPDNSLIKAIHLLMEAGKLNRWSDIFCLRDHRTHVVLHTIQDERHDLRDALFDAAQLRFFVDTGGDLYLNPVAVQSIKPDDGGHFKSEITAKGGNAKRYAFFSADRIIRDIFAVSLTIGQPLQLPQESPQNRRWPRIPGDANFDPAPKTITNDFFDDPHDRPVNRSPSHSRRRIPVHGG